MKSIWTRLACCCAVALPLGLAAAAEDRVDLRNGQSVTGRIVEETRTEVVVQSSSNMLRIPVNQLKQIHYEGQPAVLTHAKTMEDAQKLGQAADEYSQAQAEIKDRPVILHAARFGEARVRARLALQEDTLLDEAIARLENVDRASSNSRHYFMAREFLGRLYLRKKEYRKAFEAFDELSTAPWREAKLHAVVYQARTLQGEHRFEEALQLLEPELATPTDSPEEMTIMFGVQVEKARSLRGLDRRDDEAEVLERAIDRAPESAADSLAQAYLALGEARLAQGKKWEAIWAFMHVQLLFARHGELHAQALYNLAHLWDEVGRPERAAAAQTTLKTEHPQSPWTKKLGS
jgi:tetratricopeptide (TPR) repeat protein